MFSKDTYANTALETVQEAAATYRQVGLLAIPLQTRSKVPEGKWGDAEATETFDIEDFRGNQNIGLVLGKRSSGLVDLDFDMPEAGLVGTKLFLKVARFGRPSSPNGHAMLICKDAGKTKQFGLTGSEASVLGLRANEKNMILEVRGNGGYTMVPPSIHPSGERLEWINSPKNLPEMSYNEICKLAGICAGLAVVLRAYPTQAGCRSKVCLALAGVLTKLGFNSVLADEIIVWLAGQKGDEEAQQRRCADATRRKHESGEEIIGLTTLCDLLGLSELFPKLHEWFFGNKFVGDSEQKIAELNEKFFVVESEGGKCRVGSLEATDFGRGHVRNTLVFSSFDDLRKRYQNQVIIVTTKKGATERSLGDYWLNHPKRRQYSRVVFSPGQEVPANYFNLWQGFAVVADKGSWRRMMRHIWLVLAGKDRESFLYIVRWLAWTTQNLDRPAEVALVFKGGKGSGKGTLGRALVTIFGQHGLQIFSSQHLLGRFNSHLRACILLFADEAIAPTEKKAESYLKGLITEPWTTIEQKGFDAFQTKNFLHIVMASNADWVVPASADERRFAVFNVSDVKTGDRAWFAALNDEMDNGGLEAMLYWLTNLRLGKWHPRTSIPKNGGLRDQQIASLQGIEAVWFNWLQSAQVPATMLVGASNRIGTEAFAKDVGTNPTAAGRFLDRMGCTQSRALRPSGWIIPPLTLARKIWDDQRFSGEWDNTPEWENGSYRSEPF